MCLVGKLYSMDVIVEMPVNFSLRVLSCPVWFCCFFCFAFSEGMCTVFAEMTLIIVQLQTRECCWLTNDRSVRVADTWQKTRLMLIISRTPLSFRRVVSKTGAHRAVSCYSPEPEPGADCRSVLRTDWPTADASEPWSFPGQRSILAPTFSIGLCAGCCQCLPMIQLFLPFVCPCWRRVKCGGWTGVSSLAGPVLFVSAIRCFFREFGRRVLFNH